MKKKNIIDLAPATFSDKRKNGLLPWTKLYAESVQNFKNPAIPDRAKVVWVLLQPLLKRSEEPGFLVEEGKPMSIQSLAMELWRDEQQLTDDIETLLRCRWLKRDERGVILDPIMVLDLAATEYRASEATSLPNGGHDYTLSEKIRSDQTRQRSESESDFKEGSDRNSEPPDDSDAPASAAVGSASGPSPEMAKLAPDVTPEWLGTLKVNPANSGKDVNAIVMRARKHRKYIDGGVVITRQIINGWLKREPLGKAAKPAPVDAEAKRKRIEQIRQKREEKLKDFSPCIGYETRYSDSAENRTARRIREIIGFEPEQSEIFDWLDTGILARFEPDKETWAGNKAYGIAGANNVVKDENGIVRMKGSKWLEKAA
jgi:hypothetical protein